MTFVAKIKRFLARDKRTYERLQAQKQQRVDLREDALDERLQDGFPSAEAVRQSYWTL